MIGRRALERAFAVVVPAAVFGFLVTTQWSSVAAPGAQDVTIRYVDTLTQSVTRLQTEQTSLKARLAAVRAKLDELQRAGAQETGVAKELETRIEDLKARAGLTEVSGAGVRMTLDAPAPPAGAPAAARAPCLAPDLTDLVNAAWRGGARAVAINDERLVASSSVYCVGATIVVNGGIVSAPFTVSAVGPPAAILAVIDDPAHLRDLKRRRDEQAVHLRIAAAPLIDLPAYAGPLGMRKAVPR